MSTTTRSQVNKPYVTPGATAWLLDRARVRSGDGPTKIVIAEVFKTGDIRPAGSRGTYKQGDVFETENEAKLAWFDRSDAELKVEQARFNKISARLCVGLSRGAF